MLFHMKLHVASLGTAVGACTAPEDLCVPYRLLRHSRGRLIVVFCQPECPVFFDVRHPAFNVPWPRVVSVPHMHQDDVIPLRNKVTEAATVRLDSCVGP
uniref:Secreted protein n=1 Tax=Ixodes ricinus TaxID=34613 RepID=A0A6B0UEB5_IXORI